MKVAPKITAGLIGFLKLESAGGILLIFASTLAIIIANSNIAYLYDGFQNYVLGFDLGLIQLQKPILLWVNDGLMAIFFMLVGLEMKREFLAGELSQPSQIVLPAIAAVGGMVVPALMYAYFNYDDPVTLHGWAIPAATDIAFALGVLSLVGNRVPLSIKVLLTAVAIFDDLGAIIIIALFYTSELSVFSLILASAAISVLLYFNRSKVRSLAPYLLVGIFLWACVLKSGIHATLAGVVIALMIPGNKTKGQVCSPLEKLEDSLHPWVTFLILPMFAFANAGVSLLDLQPNDLLNPVSLGIFAGLFFGKQLGIFTAIYATIKLGWAEMPKGSGWRSLYAVSTLCGIGFTMSLFIGNLAFDGKPQYAAYVRIGVLVGSLMSALLGYLLMRSCCAVKGETAIAESKKA